MQTYECRKCGHEVHSSRRPGAIRWDDGHVCYFNEIPSVRNTLEALGFRVYHTGGGCMSYILERTKDSYWLITDKEGCDMPFSIYEPILFGYFWADGNEYETNDFTSVKEFVEAWA